MGIIRNKKGFTLAEVMIVLLVLTILFAAMAPIITKKRTSTKDEDYWNWASRDFSKPMNAQKSNTDGSIFFGTTPINSDAITNIFSPNSKVIIRSGTVANNEIQRQIQLHYNKTAAGTIIADNTNLLLGYRYWFLGQNVKYSDLQYPKNNLAIGYGALENLGQAETNIHDNTAIGYEALLFANGNGNTAVGSNAGRYNLGSENVFIGSGADASGHVNRNTLIGYNSKSNASNNTFIGVNSGNEEATAYNTAVGDNTLRNLSSGNYNIAVGYGALEKLESGSNNVALGYNACSNLKNGSNKTCIGSNSGPINGRYEGDNFYRTFIGNAHNINSAYGGDAVLEIHNMGDHRRSKLANNPNIQSDTTTVVNGNLVVKGRTYFTVGNYLYPFTISGNNFLVNNLSSPCATNQLSYSFGCSSINLSSDRRLKYIGSRFNGGLDEINKLQVYNYTYKKDPKKEPHTGVIAQQLQKVFPSAVSKDEDGYLRIRWDEMFYACINAIKTLNQRVASLVKRTLTLENEITKLEKENSKLKAEVENISSRVKKLKAQKSR